MDMNFHILADLSAFALKSNQRNFNPTKQTNPKQATRGHNIVADGWAGAANPHPHPTPHPIPRLTQTHTQKASKTLVSPLFDSC